MARHPVLLSDDDLLSECSVTRLKRGGPGGQHRNKVETAVRLVHEPSGVIAEANETRSQERNRAEAVSRLRYLLALECRSDDRPAEDLADIWDQHRKGDRMPTSAHANSAPLLLTHVFDTLDEMNYELPASAKLLHISTSQLVKFLKSNGQVWQAVNARRAKLDMPPLK